MKTISDRERAAWMRVLAQAPADLLVAVWDATGLEPQFEWLREPEFGAVMVRGRLGATGAPFNLGEMTVTRCSLRLRDGAVGHAWVSGRDRDKARIAAVCDALLQDEGAAPDIRAQVLTPLEDVALDARQDRASRAAATRVEFFTMTRGEE